MSMLFQNLARSLAVNDEMSAPHLRAAPSPPRPILDLVQLARRSRGDRVLEMELLGQFDRQAGLAGARLRAAADVEAALFAARMLAATARIAGAFAVAAACDGYVASLAATVAERDRTLALDRLEGEIALARGAISDLLAQEGR